MMTFRSRRRWVGETILLVCFLGGLSLWVMTASLALAIVWTTWAMWHDSRRQVLLGNDAPTSLLCNDRVAIALVYASIVGVSAYYLVLPFIVHPPTTLFVGLQFGFAVVMTGFCVRMLALAVSGRCKRPPGNANSDSRSAGERSN